MEKLPLFGLLEDALLPGEERALGHPALDLPHLKVLAGFVGQQAVFVTITAPVELPSLVTGRHGTLAEVVRADGDTFVLKGLVRVRLGKVTKAEPPFLAEVERMDVESPDDKRTVAAVKALASVLAAGGVAEGAAEQLRPLAASLLRASVPASELTELLRKPLPDVLEETAARVKGRGPAFAGEAVMEASIKALSTLDAQSAAQKRRLWGRVVELQRKLDVYDPATPTEGDDLSRLERKLRQAGLPTAAREFAKRELRLIRSGSQRDHEYATYLSHLELMAKLPWHPGELPPIDLAKVEAQLDRDHAGMAKVKRRVLEYLAVRTLGGTAQSTVLCLVGPPGTGKTTIAKSIAEALGRPFARVSLGGVHDECELRGHRPTFAAASSGRIIQAVATAGSQNALLLLDEIDKLGSDTSRSPMGALLEILDPAQHTEFGDHFLQVPYDLSHVFFICTANDASKIHPVLLDRFELVELDGYGIEEKLQLVRSHLMPRVAKEIALGLIPEASDATLIALIEGHTREAGLRQLQRALASLLRARALSKVKSQADVGGPITDDEVTKVLGRGRVARHLRDDALPVGVSYGLSTSGEGGSLLPIEVVRLDGKGRLELTGRLGKVLEESVRAVVSHLKHRAIDYGIDPAAFTSDLHVHLPDGATPKDGPSAGVALAVAVTSALTGRRVRADFAFTGELTLSGKVTAVGGVRAKVLAAERAGINQVFVPADNRSDLPDALRVTPVLTTTLADVLRVAFSEEPVHADAPAPHLADAAAPVAARGA